MTVLRAARPDSRRRILIATLVCGVALYGATTRRLSAGAALPTETDSLKASAMRTRLYVGMWSTHLRHLDEGVDGNSLLGLAYRGYFGATFINSWGNRALAAGIQRSFTRPRRGTWATALGYRAGLVTGYDERFLALAEKTPVLPFAQIIGSLDYRKFGVELAYTGIVMSVTANWRL